MRVKRGIHRHRRVKDLRALTKGYRGTRSATVKKGKEALLKAGQNAYRDRKLKKRTFRSLWITRYSAYLRANGLMYSRASKVFKDKKILLNHKILSELAIHHPAVLDKVLEVAGLKK